MIIDVLKDLGLSDKETAVYLAVLKQGKVAPAKVAVITGLKRTTVYSVAKDLAKMGLITEDLAGKKSFLVANPPEDIKAFIQAEERELENKKRLAYKAVELAKDYISTANLPLPKVTYISEKDLNTYLYKRTPIWHESMLKHDGIWWGFQDPELPRLYEKWIVWQWTDGYTPGIQLRLFSGKHEIENKLKQFHHRQIRPYPDYHDFDSTTWVCGDYLIMIVTKTNPHYLVEIYDPILTHNTREMYKKLWETLPA